MKPILFNTEMVRAILDGRKTVTRRVIKPQNAVSEFADGITVTIPKSNGYVDLKPFAKGDILYVRETFYKTPHRYMYKADYSEKEKFYMAGKEISIKWRPSIHMPKEAARIFLRVTNVRVERLQDIACDEIKQEGLEVTGDVNDEGAEQFAKAVFGVKVWNSTIKPSDLDRYGWDANPFVWVIEFEKTDKGGQNDHRTA